MTYTAAVPTVGDAERDARKLLEGWWTSPAKDAPLPVDPMRVARRLGIQVRKIYLRSDESGNIVLPPDGANEPPVISLNRWDAESRQRFTCAHEIGHYLRREAGELRPHRFIDYRDTLAGLGTDPEEIYANQFAAALLMPAHLVGQWYETESAERLACRFATSTQAMNLRLRNLRLSS